MAVQPEGALPALMIFDCDGVLVDSERLTVEIEAQLLTQMGWPLTVDDVVRRFMGGSDADMLAAIEHELGPEKTAEFDRVSSDRIRAAFHERLTAIEGVRELIDSLHDQGIDTCIASSGSYAKMDITLAVTDLHSRFAGRIYSASEVARGKPAPDLFLHAAAAMGHAPRHCAVIEDSARGVQAAVAAGMTCYGFAGGLSAETDLVAAGAIPFASMAELQARFMLNE